MPVLAMDTGAAESERPVTYPGVARWVNAAVASGGKAAAARSRAGLLTFSNV
jgi:hypothetical protein